MYILGKAYRLFTAEAYRTVLKERLPPEIQRANLAPVTLQLKALGYEQLGQVSWRKERRETDTQKVKQSQNAVPFFFFFV